MRDVANRRELLAATQALVKTNAPDAEHYNRLMTALSAVASEDIGRPIKAVLAVTRDELNRANTEPT
jgi:wyosine [tRNA(Phe)-imidazoG37] synthetase (radical SAM superfamily)